MKEIGPPPQEHREPASKHDAEHRTKTPRPALNRAEPGLRPVSATHERAHLTAAGERIVAMKAPTIDGLRFRVPSGLRAHAVVRTGRRRTVLRVTCSLSAHQLSRPELSTDGQGPTDPGQASACAVLAHDVLALVCGRRQHRRRYRSARHVPGVGVWIGADCVPGRARWSDGQPSRRSMSRSARRSIRRFRPGWSGRSWIADSPSPSSGWAGHCQMPRPSRRLRTWSGGPRPTRPPRLPT